MDLRVGIGDFDEANAEEIARNRVFTPTRTDKSILSLESFLTGQKGVTAFRDDV